MHNRSNYWSCTQFANCIRGTEKPYALEWEAWDLWHDEAAAAHPFRYWVAEKLLNGIQNFLWWPYDRYWDIRYYLKYRFIDRSHLIQTGLTPGCYHEFEDKVLHGLFSELVTFVEIELSLHHRVWNDGPRKPCRNAEWGLKHLEWEMGLVWDESSGLAPGDEQYGQPTHQAVAAKETLALYDWGKNVAPGRVDPYDYIHEEFEEYHARYGDVNRLEAEHEAEDTRMLV